MAEIAGGTRVFQRCLRVLLVDDEPTSLIDMKNLLESCSYEVMAVEQVSAAMSKLGRSCQFDLILADINMKDMDAFSFLKIAVFLTNLPIILMSNSYNSSIALKAIEEGACFFIVKPVRIEVLNNLWQHVFQRKRKEMREVKAAARSAINKPDESGLELIGVTEANNRENRFNRNKVKVTEEPMRLGNLNEVSKRNSWNEEWESNQYKQERVTERRKKNAEESEQTTERMRHPRMFWTKERHLKFLNAVNQLKGKEKIVPRRILELMNEPGLTMKQIASHLQKHRMRVQGHQNRSEINPSQYIRPEASVPLTKLSTLLNNRPKFPPFIEKSYSMMIQAGASSCQNHGAQPLEPTGSSRNYYSQDNLTSRNVAASRYVQPIMRPSGILQQAPGASGLPMQPSGGDSLDAGGFDTSTGTGYVNETHMDIQASTGFLSYNSVGNPEMFGNLEMLGENGRNDSTMGDVENYEMPIDGGLDGLNLNGEIGGTLQNINQQNLVSSGNTDKFFPPGSDLFPLQVPEFSPTNSNFNTVTPPSVTSSNNVPDPNLTHEVQDNDFRATSNDSDVGDFDDYLEEYTFEDNYFLRQFDELNFS